MPNASTSFSGNLTRFTRYKTTHGIGAFVDEWRANRGGIIFLDVAPKKGEIAELWADNGSRKHHRKTLVHFTHVNLLYGMRNGLLHQQYAAKGLPVFPKEQNNVYYLFWNKNVEGEGWN